MGWGWQDVSWCVEQLLGCRRIWYRDVIPNELWCLMNRYVVVEELAISECHTPGSIYTYSVLVMLSDFDDRSGFVPLLWMRANLVLQSYAITNTEWGQTFCVLLQTFSYLHVTMAKCILPVLEDVLPCGMW